MGKNNTQKDTALLSVRAAVILLLATLVGVVAQGLGKVVCPAG